MRALSLTQPWASLVALGEKRIETRTWSTHYRGPLAIHAAKGLSGLGGENGLREICLEEPYRTALARHSPTPPWLWLPRGAVIAVAKLTACHSTAPDMLTGDWVSTLDWREESFGDYSPGRFGWVLDDIVPLKEPVPARGSLGLWTWEP